MSGIFFPMISLTEWFLRAAVPSLVRRCFYIFVRKLTAFMIIFLWLVTGLKDRQGSNKQGLVKNSMTWIVNYRIQASASIYSALLQPPFLFIYLFIFAYYDLILSCKHTQMLIIWVLADAFLPSSVVSCRLKGLELSVSSPLSTRSILYQCSGSAALIIIWPHLFAWLGELWLFYSAYCENTTKVGVFILHS